ncbi:hypothetical protein H9Y04_16170 [Streptomyces sp. TRM66268-LWL]|uniref:Uncharacterized protein n=1 Tax=Streptomyces polyasparticus TaxID=2767826 RepID=A0ABR7SGV4_9ACTN|nr:hypothetical protein [Streptomyces polyasparticus]MBC9714099.1 hypothetical protein [Streptomyces polyasparticus]
MRKTLSRIAVAGTGVATLLVFTASPALADTNRTITSSHGKFTFIDDGDMFEVCDTKADGFGVKGRLLESGTNDFVLTVEDGGDANCGKDGYNIGNLRDYQMWLTWNGGGAPVKSIWFNE